MSSLQSECLCMVQSTDRYLNPFVSKELMGLKTIAAAAKAGTKSIKATVPEGIVEFLAIEAGDDLDWSMVVKPNGKRVAEVSRAD